MTGLFVLPIELLLKLIELCPNLIYVNRQLFAIGNEIYKEKCIRLAELNGFKINEGLFVKYQNTLDFYNGSLSELVKPEINYYLYYSFISNRKLLFTEANTIIQPFGGELSYNFNDSVKLDEIQSFKSIFKIFLPPGRYKFQLGLINHSESRGLGTFSFKLNKETFYMSTFINDILPKEENCIVQLGEINVESEVYIEIKEEGMYPKRNIEFQFIEFRLDGEVFEFYSYKGINSIELDNYKSMQNIISGTSPNMNWDHFYRNDIRNLKLKTVIEQLLLQEIMTTKIGTKSKLPLRWRRR